METNREVDKSAESHVEGQQFDSPLIMQGAIGADDYEPQRYVAEKPYDLTRYEYSILRRPYSADFWFNLIAGGTAGIVISVVGKSISALLDKQEPSLETWEIVAVVVGVIGSVIIKKWLKSSDDKERCQLMDVMDSHFTENKPRRLHLTKGANDEN
jgi:hypothetical protein